MPDWSSLGAKAALELGQADGLFSWAAWPSGPDDMDAHVDASYPQFLNETDTPLPYMMPVSPWFFTNLPGYDKNWMWRSDDLWFDRWQEVWYVRPDLVEIITWNDFDMPHDGWRLFLPYVIDMYKYGTASVAQEGLVTWYLLYPANAPCSSGNTSANTHTQFQYEYEPSEVAEDCIFYSALLASDADVTVTIGSSVISGKWRNIPDGGIGIYHGSVLTSGQTRAVTIVISRSGTTLATVIGAGITEACPHGIQNWNAWVGADSGLAIPAATPTLTLDEQVCINGTGFGSFADLCEFSCGYGYCPIGACTCAAMGKQVPLPPYVGVKGYPLSGESASYSGLCAFACDLDYCPDTACGTVSAPLSTPTSSPFDPLVCNSGFGEGNLRGLCDFACHFGYCPLHSCTCGSTGELVALPAYTPMVVKPAPGLDEFIYGDLCQFSCEYDYCPKAACNNSTGAPETIYVDQIIFVEPSPVFVCPPPCIFVMPSSTMNSETVITFPPISTPIVVGSSTILSITPAPMTTSVISFFDMSIEAGESSFTFALTSSFEPEPLVITVGIITTTVYFLPVAGSALGQATPDIYYSLGTTVYTSGGLTQTFSEDQFTNLRTLTAPTTITTSLVERSTGSSTTSSTTTVIPIWVQAGGCYVSPVPLPTPGPLKFPSLPEFPPIPNPPCFSGNSAEPTCTTSCGSPCTANCDTTGTPTSTECSTTTATNYWVSCASSSCVTTTSSTITGCAVEPSITTITEADYCPLAALPPGDDEGFDEDISITPIWTIVQTTISERVYMSGSTYTVKSGSITVNGVGYSVPAVSASSVLVIGGSTATIYPPVVASAGSITAASYGTNPLTPSSTATPVQSTTTPSLPIPTVEIPRMGKYTASASIMMGNTLSPGGPQYTYVYTDPTGVNVIAQLNWAADQTGCSPESGWALESDDCIVHLDYNLLRCDEDSIDDNYGGAYVWNGPFGCIEYMLYAVDSGSGSSTCSCSEDGCTPDSPACCADGTCDSTRKSVMNRVTLIPWSLELVGGLNNTGK
ncbi:hypothetical protein EAF04_007677 [Stromatinia cepivora]|nr:hypothetical protein EAF04_007677 [Stromatinia cepivora]